MRGGETIYLLAYLGNEGVLKPEPRGTTDPSTWDFSKRWPYSDYVFPGAGRTEETDPVRGMQAHPSNRPGAKPLREITGGDIDDLFTGLEGLLRDQPPSDEMGR